MLLAEVGCTFVGFILCISGIHGQSSSICALKGSSVDLSCSAKHPTSSMKWYTLHWDGPITVAKEVSADGNRIKYNMTEENRPTLTIKYMTESDANVYCCRETAEEPYLCWFYRTELKVTDLQVKVIPTTEGQTVTLMCSTSCPLTENPAAYIWYKNREFLYQDWSPWYQQLVSSEEAVRYSCAIKGYEDLRAPEVSVDSVTSTCFTVTYAKGTMCSYEQTSVDEPCSITYPTEVHVQKTPAETYVQLSCHTSCPMTDSKTAYRWYTNENRYFESQHLSVSFSSDKSFSCAIKGHEDLRSAEVCMKDKNCSSVNYVSRRICALQGSSVNISSEYSHPNNQQPKYKLWYKRKRSDEEAAELIKAAGRVEHEDNMKNQHMLTIKNLKKNDSAEYMFRLQRDDKGWTKSDLPGVNLVVTGVRVKFTPSAVVTEGQRVTLTCSTSCPLTDNTKYTWYLNSRPLTLPQNQNKHLLLDSVSSQHAGNYSCAVKTHKTNISSDRKTLTIQARGNSMPIINAVRLVVALLIPIPLLLFHLWLRKKKHLHSMRTSQSQS